MTSPGKAGSGVRGWWLLAGLAGLIALYGLRTALVGEPTYPPELRPSLTARPWAILPHAGLGGLALLLGPLQFHRGIRRRRALHRALGITYVVACLITGLAGLALAPHAYAGVGTALGFAMLALALLVSTGVAWTQARRHDYARHREWMIRSFALILAAVTLRIELPILTIAFGDFKPAYQAIAWVCWVPNLFMAEWYVRRTRGAPLPL